MNQHEREMFENGYRPTLDGYWVHDPANAGILLQLADIKVVMEKILERLTPKPEAEPDDGRW